MSFAIPACVIPVAPVAAPVSSAKLSGRERRIHTRLSPRELGTPASIRIPNRPAVSLVDLSPGGALLDLPFQIRPDTRLNVEFRAATERMMLPFRLLRCYVTSLEGGVRYQAAGAFEEQLDWKPLLVESAAHATLSRLIATLEAFLRHGSSTGRSFEFDQLLMWILDAARRGERADRIGVEIRLRLARLIPSVAIEPATRPTLPDPAKGARFFEFDFKCDRPLTTPERRILRASAQLLSIVNGNVNVTALDAPKLSAPLDFRPRHVIESPLITYSVADWQEVGQDDELLPRDPWRRRTA